MNTIVFQKYYFVHSGITKSRYNILTLLKWQHRREAFCDFEVQIKNECHLTSILLYAWLNIINI